MAIFLDSAVLADVRAAAKLGFVAGVTTNPTLVASAREANRAEGVLNNVELFKHILELIPGPVFAQVREASEAEMAEEAELYLKLDPARICPKIPCTTDGLKLARCLTARGGRTLLTAVFTPAQAYACADAGATFIAPYVGRWERTTGESGDVFISRLALALSSAADWWPARPQTKIIAASLKSVEAAINVLLAGADAVTVPLEVLQGWLQHQLTTDALAKFAQV